MVRQVIKLVFLPLHDCDAWLIKNNFFILVFGKIFTELFHDLKGVQDQNDLKWFQAQDGKASY